MNRFCAEDFEFSLKNNDENLLEQVKCGICLDTMKNPILITSCQHRFCEACINRLLASSKNAICPMCREPCKKTNCFPDRLTSNLLNVLRVDCPHDISLGAGEDPVCGWSGSRELITEHLTSQCKFLKKCRCGKIFKREEYENHQQECELTDTACPCGMIVQNCQLAQHQLRCDASPVKCIAANYGCDWEDLRKHLPEHVQSCSPAKLVGIIGKYKRKLSKIDEDKVFFSTYFNSIGFQMIGLNDKDVVRKTKTQKLIRTFYELNYELKFHSQPGYAITLTGVHMDGVFLWSSADKRCNLDINFAEKIMAITMTDGHDRLFLLPSNRTEISVSKTRGKINFEFGEAGEEYSDVVYTVVYAARKWKNFRSGNECPFILENSQKMFSKFSLKGANPAHTQEIYDEIERFLNTL